MDMGESTSETDCRSSQSETPAAFNMRLCTLSNMRSILGARNPAKFQTPAIFRISQNVCSDVNKTLELLRLIVQPSINKEIDAIINKYVEKFFAPAVRNIRINYGEHVVDDRHVNHVCCQMLENAKKMYDSKPKVGELISPKSADTHAQPPPASSVDIEILENDKATQDAAGIYAEIRNKPQTSDGSPCSSRGTPTNLKLSDVPFNEIENWNPTRIDHKTLFITGHAANKVLGLTKQKSKIYSKFPSLFRYVGDSQDRQWLIDNKLHPGKSPARVFISILSDIRSLTGSLEHNATAELGFQLPDKILLKVKYHMKEVYEELCKRRESEFAFRKEETHFNAL